jgi:hypothetical protein
MGNEVLILKKRIDREVNEFRRHLVYLYQCRSDEILETIDYYESIIDCLKEGTRLVLDFNNLKEDVGKVRPCGLVGGLEGQQAGKTVQNLNGVLRELQTAQDYLYHFLKPNLSEKEQSKIEWAREELEKLRGRNIGIDLSQNLEEAIQEGEFGHHLACGIISARIIDHIIHTIKEKESLSEYNLNENIITRLRELGILKADKIAGQDKKEFLDAAKSARDAVTHNLEFMPNGPKAFSLLSYAFIISDLFVKYKEIRKNGES